MQETATLAAGCFWGIEEAFMAVDGVLSTRVGYIGGHTNNPTYRDVCGGNTNHAEAVEVVYDAERVSYADLLALFWRIHDPTTLNRQGPDIGTQYRSAIFYHNDAQKTVAEQSKAQQEQSKRFPRPVVTEIAAAAPFYEAEEYHQQYNLKNGRHCSI